MAQYVALMDGEPGAFGFAFPDLPGCTAMGADENEAFTNAVDALAEWIGDAGGPEHAPRQRDIVALRRDPEVREALQSGAIFVRVPLVLESARLVRANISIDQGLLEAIDAAAKRSRLTRSGFLASAAREKILAGK